jgi:hypothetical protein
MYYFLAFILSRAVTPLFAQNVTASSTDPHFVNLSVNPAVSSSWPAKITSLVMGSMHIISLYVAPEPIHASVVPFFIVPRPFGGTGSAGLSSLLS